MITGGPQSLAATLYDGATPVAPTSISGSLRGLDAVAQPLAFRDDGLNGDAVAGDKIYTAAFAAGALCGTYRVEVTATAATTEGVVTRQQVSSFDAYVAGDAVRDPCNSDEDGDGLTDDDELNTRHTDPLNADSDGDGYTDGAEVALAKSPLVYCAIMRADVTGDGKVNVLDLAAAGGYYNQSVPPAPARFDQNGDAKIQVLDLSMMAAQYNKPVSGCP